VLAQVAIIQEVRSGLCASYTVVARARAVASGPQAAGFTATESHRCIPSHQSLHLWRRPTGKSLAGARVEISKPLNFS